MSRSILLSACSACVVWAVAIRTVGGQLQKDGAPVAIGTYRTLHSAILGEDRQLLIHVPDDYDRTTLRYPVLFHLYGEQVAHYFADAVMTVHRLGSAAEVPPMIVVGVANTDRYRDNLPLQADGRGSGGAGAFLRFFSDELIPFVDAHYRTKPYRLLAGPQAGAAFGLHALMTRPGLFNAHILRIENPFPGDRAFRQFFLDKAALFVRDTPALTAFVRLTVDSSAPSQTLEFVRGFTAVIEGRKPAGLRFESHVEAPSGDFVQLVGLAPALRSLFDGYAMPNDPLLDTPEAIERYYRALSAKQGLELDPPDLSLTFAIDRLADGGRLEAALELAGYALRVQPASLNALWRLGEINRRLGRLAEARDAYTRFLAIRPNDASLIRQRLAEVEKALEVKK